ncbi:MAG: hypothetical protein AAFX80_12800 [Cyanobacteria bacterium J06639_18]
MPLSVIQHNPPSSMGDTETSHQNLTCAEYFAGIGLVRLGLEQAGWRVLFANDWSHDIYRFI